MRISDWSSDVCSSDLDNGQFTVMRFPNQREIPAIFTVNPDGSEATASFDVRDEFVVIHGVYKELRLRRGKVVLCIYNESPSFYGRDPKTDTASRSEEHTSELQSQKRTSYAYYCLK